MRQGRVRALLGVIAVLVLVNVLLVVLLMRGSSYAASGVQYRVVDLAHLKECGAATLAYGRAESCGKAMEGLFNTNGKEGWTLVQVEMSTGLAIFRK